MDYIGAFYSQKHTEETLHKGIDSILGSHKKLNVYFFPVYIKPSYFSTLKNGNSQCKLVSENGGIFLFDCSFQIRNFGQKGIISGKVFIVKNKEYDDIYTVITLENSQFFSRGIYPYFLKNFPRVSLTFITHKKLKNLLLEFRDGNNFKSLTIVRTTTYSRVGKKIMPSVNWPEFDLEKAFEWVDNENGWFKNLKFQIKKPHEPKIEISISRKGVIKTNRYFKLLYEYFILPISKTVYENIKIFSRRARLDNPNRDISPLCIDFGYGRFTEVEENNKFIDSFKNMKASSVSVIHGNPYIHLSLFDYFDGSSFDIWVLSTDKIVIVPQLKASFQSIKRLMNHIFDNYAEGDIKDFEVAE
ncbi:hypothetical protein KKC91_03005 [bacterium]|nr:hypothetical protein [bacterium]